MAAKPKNKSAGTIRVGIGGWTFEPWRGVFYPKDLSQKRELEYASSKLSSIEINGTYYSTFKPPSWIKWREETPKGFVFAVKASRFCTNRKELGAAGESVTRFINQGLHELGDKLGPINWQFMATKKFDAADFGAFLSLLPKKIGSRAIRHAVEVRHDSFACKEFVALCRAHDVAIVAGADSDFPLIADVTLQSGGIVVVTGKGYGATNFIAMDRNGEVLVDRQIQVEGPTDQLVTVYRGVERESYSCMPICQRRVTLGDADGYFKSAIDQAGSLSAQAAGSAGAGSK